MTKSLLVALVGPAGAGKTTFADQLERELGWVHVANDEIRRELTGHRPTYTLAEDRAVYEEARHQVLAAAKRGEHVVHDATNLKAEVRRQLLHDCGAACEIVWVIPFAQEDVMRARQGDRDANEPLPAEFGLTQWTLYQFQAAQLEAISDACILVDTGQALDGAVRLLSLLARASAATANC